MTTTRFAALRRQLLALCAATGAVTLSSGGLAHDHSAHAAHTAAAPSGYERSLHEYVIPDVVLTDADAHPVRLRELLATKDTVMLNFIFTTCGAICPVMSQTFSEVPKKLGTATRGLRMISISIDPENDTPEKLKAYSRTYGNTDRWTFLTGRREDIKAVEVAFDSYRGDKMNHEPLTLLHASADKRWVRLDGFASSDSLAKEWLKLSQP
jgi:protein SCO1/2